MAIVVPHVLDEHIDTTPRERLLTSKAGCEARNRVDGADIVARRYPLDARVVNSKHALGLVG